MAQSYFQPHKLQVSVKVVLLLTVILVSGRSRTHPAENLEVTLWAEQPLIKNPVALSHDPEGRIYVTETARRASADIDVRRTPGLEPLPWQVLDWTLQSADEKRDLIRRILAPGSTYNNPWMQDRNEDGSKDWYDLATISEKVHLLEDTDDDGRADRFQVFADGFDSEDTGVMAGVLWHPDGVYAAVLPDLWRLRDLDNDGRAEEKESLFHGVGVHLGQGGHDMHGLIVGPDGKIYWTIGDKGISVTSREGRRFHYPNQGVLMRANPDGSEFEVFAHGLRNCQEPAFDAYGNWFCVDNDGDFRGERERFVYVAEGSDSGWRINWQYNLTNRWAEQNRMPQYNPWMEERLFVPHFEGQAAYITPPLSNYSNGPCGFAYNPGTALNGDYKDFFFLTQFPSKLTTSFQVRPRGAGFEMINEHVFHEGLMGTGLSFGPDGALYMADWGNDGYALNESGAIHKLDFPGAAEIPARLETRQLIREGMSDRTDDRLVELLNHADQRVRLQAQFELVKRRKDARLMEVAFDAEAPQLARIHALWGMGQLARSSDLSLSRTLDALLNDPDHEIRAQAAQFIATLKPDRAEALLLPLLEDAQPRVRYHAAMALGKTGSAGSFEPLVALLAENDNEDTYLRHAGIMGLVGIGNVEGLVTLQSHRSVAVRLAAVVALRRLERPEVATFLQDSNEQVVLESARAIHDDFSIPAAMPALAALAGTTQTNNEALLRRVLNANYRVGTQEAAQTLMNFALDTGRPESMRVEALLALSTWNDPPILDRVERRYRPGLKSPRYDVTPMLETHRAALTAFEQQALREAGFALIQSYVASVDERQRMSWLEDERQPRSIRLAAFRTLYENGSETTRDNLLQTIMSDPDDTLRSDALEILAAVDPARTYLHIERVLESGRSVQEQQRALRRLGSIRSDPAVALLQDWLNRLEQNEVPPALRLDVYEAASGHPNDEIQTIRNRIEATLQSGSLIEQYQYALEGGNAERGRQWFEEHPAAQCVLCHRVGSEGSTVGPDLAGISSKRNRRYLLESLLDPAAQLADGYTVASMPPMGSILEPGQIRDIVEYLSGL